jgi:hypothetical protein
MITEITRENLSSIKELMRAQEVRHINAFKLNFGVSDGMFSAPTSVYSMSAEPQCIWSNSKDLIIQHQYLFDTLWSKAIPARQRIREIEHGAKTEFVETFRDPEEIQQLSIDLIERTQEEISILFSAANAIHRQVLAEDLLLLKEAASQRSVKIRVLVPVDDGNNRVKIIANEKIQELIDLGIDIRQIKREEKPYPLQNKLILLIADQSVCLTVELEENPREALEEVIRLATYSNSEPTIFAYSSIFENLWIHAEIMTGDSVTLARKEE